MKLMELSLKSRGRFPSNKIKKEGKRGRRVTYISEAEQQRQAYSFPRVSISPLRRAGVTFGPMTSTNASPSTFQTVTVTASEHLSECQ